MVQHIIMQIGWKNIQRGQKGRKSWLQ